MGELVGYVIWAMLGWMVVHALLVTLLVTLKVREYAVITHEARAKAMALLRSHLTAAQRDTLERWDYFDVVGGTTGYRYRILAHDCHNIIQLSFLDAHVDFELCLMTDIAMPLGDQLLGQKFMLETRELEAIRTANYFPAGDHWSDVEIFPERYAENEATHVTSWGADSGWYGTTYYTAASSSTGAGTNSVAGANRAEPADDDGDARSGRLPDDGPALGTDRDAADAAGAAPRVRSWDTVSWEPVYISRRRSG